MVKKDKTISLIIPVYNEEKNVPLAYKELTKLFSEEIPNYNYEFVFTNDGSRDKTAEEVEKLTAIDKNVKYIEFSRNFGKEMAVTAGMNHCTGDACIIVDCDLQYPIEKIPEFIQKWEEGNDIVIGLRGKKNEKNFVYKWGSKIYSYIIQKISDHEIVEGAIDFRLMDRVVIDAFNELSEKNRMTRALIDWLGFKKCYVSYTEKERLYGVPAYNFNRRVKLALNGIVSQSLFPLKFAGYLGIFITSFSSLLGVMIFVEKYILQDHFRWGISGSAILALINLFLVGIMLVCLGLIALYIANIHTEVNNRPMYVVRKKKNL
jgi:glycosyltransferase involved in cell wall biosynthesis